MKNKKIPHFLAVTAFVVFIVLGLASAATLPDGPMTVKTYEMQVMPNPGVTQEKRAVVFNLVMAEKVLPKNAVGTSGGGGIGGALLSAAGNAADLASFKNGATNAQWIEQENNAIAKKQPALNEAFSARYTELNNAKTKHIAFNLNGVELKTIDYFSKADNALKTKISAICAENNTDFAITMVGQIVYAETMNAAPISVPTTIVVEVCLFDKTGALVSQGKTETVSYLTRGTRHVDTLNLLLEDAVQNIVLMLPALGGNGEKIGNKEFVQVAMKKDLGDKREAGPDETVLVVKRIDSFGGWPADLILNKGTDNERTIPIGAKSEVRVIIPNGENVLAAQVPVTGKNEKDDPVTFTASGGQITYTLSVKGTMGAGNLKTNERFTWNKL